MGSESLWTALCTCTSLAGIILPSPFGRQRQVEMRQPSSNVAPRADQKISCFQKKPPRKYRTAAEALCGCYCCWFNNSVACFSNFPFVSMYFFLSFFPPLSKKWTKKSQRINMQQFLGKCRFQFFHAMDSLCCQFSPCPAAASMKTGII